MTIEPSPQDFPLYRVALLIVDILHFISSLRTMYLETGFSLVSICKDR